MRKIIWLILMFSWLPSGAGAQEVVGSGGGSRQAGGLSMDWTLGDLMTETFSKTTLVFTQGFHQPAPRSTTGMESNAKDPGIASIYPVPTDHCLHIQLQDVRMEGFTCRLVDLTGRVLLKKQLRSQHEILDVSQMAAGNYLVQLMDRNSRIHQNTIIVKN